MLPDTGIASGRLWCGAWIMERGSIGETELSCRISGNLRKYSVHLKLYGVVKGVFQPSDSRIEEYDVADLRSTAGQERLRRICGLPLA